MRRILASVLVVALATVAAAAETRFAVDPEAGANTFTAVFDAAVGERITAVSSAVGCTFHVDEKKRVGRAQCSVALTSVKVDGDDVKSGHFWQWATNRKTEPEACAFTLDVPRLALDGTVEPMKPVAFETEGRFTLCGRRRDDGGAEKIRGTVIYLPAGSYKEARTLRVRARIEGFDRDRYQIGPQWTDGWLARVQALAPVVATVGTIEVNVFATEARK
jgi:hypothetical protein